MPESIGSKASVRSLIPTIPWGVGARGVWKCSFGGSYTLVDTIPKWRKFFEQLVLRNLVACDTETTGLNATTADIVGYSFSWGINNSYYIPIRHKQLIRDPDCTNDKKPKWIEKLSDEKQMDLDIVIKDLRRFFQSDGLTTIWHNYKFDAHFLAKEDMLPTGTVHDTMLMHNLIDENASSKLKDLATVLVDQEANKWEKAVDDFRAKFGREHKVPKKNVHYGFVPLSIMVPYAASDAVYTWLLFKQFLPLIATDKHLKALYVDTEIKLMRVLYDMEEYGVCVDREHFEKVGPILAKDMVSLEATIKSKLGSDTVNINSNVQVIPLLQKKGIKFKKKTKGGSISLDKEVLEGLASKHDICTDILQYKNFKKLKSTYVDSILEKSLQTGNIHCDYNQNVSTGRMSGKNPNLMNIPGGSPLIRSGFIPPDDMFMLLIDYSQVELRLTAHYSQDPILLRVYKGGLEDVHTRTMCEMFDMDYDEAEAIKNDDTHAQHKEIVSQRKIAKMINFLIIYGGGAKSLSVNLSTPKRVYTEAECELFIAKHSEKYNGISRWSSQVKAQVRRDCYLQNYFGRYRRFPILEKCKSGRMLYGRDKWEVIRALRQAVNYLIQSTAADVFKIAMVRAHEILKGSKSRVVMPIHDEIVFYFHKDDIPLLPEIKRQMEDFDFDVPLIADISWTNKNWAEKKELILQ